MGCVHCGSDLAAYACLSAHVDASELVHGDACEWSPDSP